MKRKLLTVLMVLLTATLCFASGAREIADDETIVKVLSIDVEDDGVYRATVLSTDGTVIQGKRRGDRLLGPVRTDPCRLGPCRQGQRNHDDEHSGTDVGH